MKLWVDDIRNAPDDSWSVARTVDSAISFIARFGNELEEISLDHDISHQVTIGTELERPFPCSETFTPVAWFIAFRYSGDLTPMITIHTSNYWGADKMKDILLSQLISEDRIRVKPMGAANRLETEIK